MRRIVLAMVLVTFGLAGSAFAAVDVELAFTPTVAAPGDEVAMFASVANLGDEDAIAEIEISITFMDQEVGPLNGQLPLAAGEELSRELAFIIPELPVSGTLTITVTATCGGATDTATASLTIEAAAGSASYEGLTGIGEDILSGLSGATAGDEETSFGELKARFR